MIPPLRSYKNFHTYKHKAKKNNNIKIEETQIITQYSKQ